MPVSTGRGLKLHKASWQPAPSRLPALNRPASRKARGGTRSVSRSQRGTGDFVQNNPAGTCRISSSFLESNPEQTLRDIYGDQAVGTFEVTPVECYNHGDATRTVF